MTQKLLEALKLHYASRISRSETNLLNYFNNPAGIGEHPDVVSEVVKLVDQIAQDKSSLSVVDSLVQAPAEEQQEDK